MKIKNLFLFGAMIFLASCSQQQQAREMALNFEHNEVDGITGEVTEDADTQGGVTLSRGSSGQLEIKPPSSRNAPCPCGSGLKYKQCHGKI